MLPPYSNAVPTQEFHRSVALLLSSQSRIPFSGGYELVKLHSLTSQSPHLKTTYVQAGHCVSKQIGRHDAACQGCPRCVSRSPEACCFRVVARAVCFSQPAVLSALLVIRLFGIVIPPPYFPKEHQKEHCGREMVAALLHYVLWCASEYSVVGRISHRSSMITLEQMFFNDASEYLFPR